MSDWLDKTKQDSREIARQICRTVNSLTYEEEIIQAFIEQLRNEHRTLQQSFGRLLIACIKHFAEMYDKGEYDLRNEDTCKMCHHLWNEIKQTNLIFLRQV